MENHKITLERRLTHRYNVGWSHLDDNEEVGTARVVSSRTKRNDGESQRVFSLLLVKSGEGEQSIKDAIRDTMQSGCRCEHDCCGHWQSSVSRVRRIKGGNVYAVLQSAYRNI
jgi:hypothetical protein